MVSPWDISGLTMLSEWFNIINHYMITVEMFISMVNLDHLPGPFFFNRDLEDLRLKFSENPATTKQRKTDFPSQSFVLPLIHVDVM